MNLEKIDESDKAMKEIKNSLRDIENFKNAEYKELGKRKDLDKEKIRKISSKARASNLVTTDMLNEEEE